MALACTQYIIYHGRCAGTEPLIGHTKQGGQMGRSHMKSDETTKSAGYASVFGFNARQLTRYLIYKVASVAANDYQIVEEAAIKQG
jgi:IS5 family transposase